MNGLSSIKKGDPRAHVEGEDGDHRTDCSYSGDIRDMRGKLFTCARFQRGGWREGRVQRGGFNQRGHCPTKATCLEAVADKRDADMIDSPLLSVK